MPLPRPILDDRSYEQLRDELIQRIPVYAPEWTDHNPSDPGITLLELFAFLGENLLYRFNQIPETTRLEFLRLLQIPLRPALPSRAMVAMSTEAAVAASPLVPRKSEALAGKLPFETRTEVRVLPLSLVAVSKAVSAAPTEDDEPEVFAFYQRALDAIDGVGEGEAPVAYENEIVPEAGDGLPVDFDRAVDGNLWLAVLAADGADPAAIRVALADHEAAPLNLNVGFTPDLEAPPADEVPPCPGEGAGDGGPAVEWQISTGVFADDDPARPSYRTLQVTGDTTAGLTREGVVRLRLPREEDRMGVFPIDDPDLAGTGQLPPQLDDESEARVVFWIRAFRPDESRFGKVLWMGANAAEVVQQRRTRPEFLGTGTAQAGQTYRLAQKPVLPGSLALQVEGPDGWQDWREVDGFHASREGDSHYVLDAEAGTVRFGSGVQGLPPQIGQRIRANGYLVGGGEAGNVAAGAIAKLPSFGSAVGVENPRPAYGGADPEATADALDRIPGELRRRDRAVTRGDFRELALATPGAEVGRAECLPLFHAPSRQSEAAGVVSVVVWPRRDARSPNAPRPDRNLLRSVCEWLDARRLVTTELYVIPPRYRKVAVSVGLEVKDGYGVEAVRHWVELVLRQYLAPLPPYGPEGQGWPLGRRVHGPELEAAALQVEGVAFLNGLEVAGWLEGEERWDEPGTVELLLDEVPELAAITVVAGDPLPPGEGLEPPAEPTPVPIPILREEC